jgi:RimJ/RimL family protein N-acetyltransferase
LTSDYPRFEFRRLTEEDLPLLTRWLNAPHVREWWYDEPLELEGVCAKFLPKIRGEVPTHPYLVLADGRPIGYLQTYRIADWPEYAAAIQVEPGAAGVDLFIGEADCLHRGWGSRLLRQFVQEVVFADPEVMGCVVGPELSNRAAIRAYEKAGFRHLKTVAVPDEREPEYLMHLGREDRPG